MTFSDGCAPFYVIFIIGAQYFDRFNDKFNKWTAIELIKTNNEAHKRLIKFVGPVGRNPHLKLKALYKNYNKEFVILEIPNSFKNEEMF